MTDIKTELDDGKIELVAFRVGRQEYCVDIMSVREIRGWTKETILPMVPAYVRGVINLRGAVVPIIDLAARLGLPPINPEARHVIIISQVGSQIVGFVVDAVSDILTTDKSNIQPAPDVASKAAREFVCGVIANDERMINLLELGKALLGDVQDLAA